MSVAYLEIVSDAVDALVALHEQAQGLRFGPPDADLGQARVATRPDGTRVGIRAPLAAHEAPIVRAYVAVDDIERAVEAAVAAGAVLAYGPVRQGGAGRFAILLQGGVQLGFRQA